MTSFRDWLERWPGEQVLLVTPEETFTAAALRERSQLLAHHAPALHGKAIALRHASLADTLAALAAFDGVAASLLLLPRGIPEARALAYRAALGAHAEVLGGDVVFLEPPSPGVSSFSETQWIIPTSGTTGEPRLVAHTLASLSRTTQAATEPGARRWGLVYDPHRFAGLQVVLQALAAGEALAAPEGIEDPAGKAAFLRGAGCTALSATPTQWRQFLMAASEPLALERVTVGGEIADQALLDALRASYPGAQVRHIYASTEAGVGFSVKDGCEGFPAQWLEEPPPGIALRVDPAGRLWIRSPGAGKSLGESHAVDGDGFVDTGDLVERAGERLRFRGRASGAINVGGNKVHPEEVERVLRAHPDVADARVYPRRSSFAGALVCADVVPVPAADRPSLPARLVAHCRGLLEGFQVPAFLRIVEALDAGGAGKVRRDAAQGST